MQRALLEGLQSAQVGGAREPGKGLYHIREHVHSTAGALLEDRDKLAELSKELTMSCLDAEAALESICQLNAAAAPALKAMESSMQAALQAADALQKRHKRASTRPRLWPRLLGRA